MMNEKVFWIIIWCVTFVCLAHCLIKLEDWKIDWLLINRTRGYYQRVAKNALKMPPETIQGYCLLAYSILFLGLALIMWAFKRRSSIALTERGPCKVYMMMRCKVKKLFEESHLNEDQSKFDAIKAEMR